MKSSSASLGAIRLARIFTDLETSARTNMMEETAPLLTMIDEEYPRVRSALLAELVTVNAGQDFLSVGAEKLSAGGSQAASILVMDDEEMIRDIARAMLEHLGYAVTTCSDGQEAISRYKDAKDCGAPFSAVIMDLGIPGGMGGEETAQHILAIDPAARLVVSSGNPEDPAMSDFEEYGFCTALKKPYKMEELARQLAF
jgi:CheY-like chemotaxis protein